MAEVEVLVSEREDIFAAVQAIFNKSKSLKVETVADFKPVYDRLVNYEPRFENIQSKIRQYNATLKDKRDKIETLAVQNAFIDLVDTAKANYFKLIQASSPPEKKPEIVSIPIRSVPQELPKIDLPIFSGNLEEWNGFYSLFDSMVHREESLSTIRKFHYLRSCLRGEALSLISGFALDEANYSLAYDALVSRYQNKRRLARFYIKRVMDFTPLNSSSASNLQKFLSEHENNFSALSALGIEDMGDFIKLHLALSNLDPGTRKAFEERIKSTDIPSYRDLINFVTERSRVVEMLAQESRSDKYNEKRKSHLVTSIQQVNLSESEDQIFPTSLSVSPLISTGSNATTNRANPNSFSAQMKSEPDGSGERFSPSSRKLTCWNCGGPHVYSRCSLPRKLFCYRCGTPGVSIHACAKCTPGNGQGNRK